MPRYIKRPRYTEAQACEAIERIFDDLRLVGQHELAFRLARDHVVDADINENLLWLLAGEVFRAQIAARDYGARKYDAAVRKARSAHTKAQRKAAASV